MRVVLYAIAGAIIAPTAFFLLMVLAWGPFILAADLFGDAFIGLGALAWAVYAGVGIGVSWALDDSKRAAHA